MAVIEPHMSSQTKINLRFSTKASNQGSYESPSSSTPNGDPLRILFPAQKKLSTIESQRILSVLDETVRKIEAALLIPSMSTSLDCLSVPFGSQLVKLLQEYREIAVEYEAVYETLNSLGITPMRAMKERKESSCSSIHSERKSLAPIDEEVKEKFYSLEQRIHHNVKSILRVVATNPAVLQTVSKDKAASHIHGHLMESIRGLRSVLNERLLTTKMEEVKRKEHMLLVAEQRMNAEDQIRQLEKELEEAEKKKEEEVYQKKSQIKQLHTDIKTVANMARDSNRRIRTEAERKSTQTKTTHTTVKAKLEEEISTLKKKLQDILTENKEREQDMRKKTFKRESEVDNWIHKYDMEMGEKQDEFEVLEEQYIEEKKQLKELEEKLGILKLKYNEVIKEQEEARMKAEKEEEERVKMNNAAILIQSCWRSFRCRKMLLREKQKDKKKGKGKKGKGKKGKGNMKVVTKN